MRALLFLLVLIVVAALSASPAGEARPPRSGFEATVSGATEALLVGRASFSVPADPADSATGLSIELEALDAQGTLLLHWTHSSLPQPGAYTVGPALGGGTLHALYISGSAESPAGVFRARHGTVRIRHSSPRLLTGTFELIAIGALGSDSIGLEAGVRIAGSFIATTVAP